MDYYEALAEKIFEHDHSQPGNPLASWGEQPDSVKAPYIRAAQVAAITLHQHNTFHVRMNPIEPAKPAG